MSAGIFDVACLFLDVGGQLGVQVEQLGIAQDGVQRGAQFVAHAGQKFAFGPAGRFGDDARLIQFCRPRLHQFLEVLPVAGEFFLGALALGYFAYGCQSHLNAIMHYGLSMGLDHDTGTIFSQHFMFDVTFNPPFMLLMTLSTSSGAIMSVVDSPINSLL